MPILTSTNIITGFLGSGKTTFIIDLLKQKPVDEYWAVLVNEFGQIGLDTQLLKAQTPHQSNILIKDIPGGCICCATQLTLKVTLNQLLKQPNPLHRLIIEPTGLGHPNHIINLLQSDQYRSRLQLQTVITLVEPAKSVQPKYYQNALYQQQIAVANLILVNKMDISPPPLVEQTTNWLNQTFSNPTIAYRWPQQIDLKWLNQAVAIASDHTGSMPEIPTLNRPLKRSREPIEHYAREADGYRCDSWIFSEQLTFEQSEIFSLLSQIPADRIKAVIKTEQGSFTLNKTDTQINIMPFAHDQRLEDSRIEIISQQSLPSHTLTKAFKTCLLRDP